MSSGKIRFASGTSCSNDIYHEKIIGKEENPEDYPRITASTLDTDTSSITLEGQIPQITVKQLDDAFVWCDDHMDVNEPIVLWAKKIPLPKKIPLAFPFSLHHLSALRVTCTLEELGWWHNPDLRVGVMQPD